MAKWIHGSLDSWHNRCMAVWMHGTMDEQQFGFMAQWMPGSLDAWYFRKHPPTPSAAVQNQNFGRPQFFWLTVIYSKSPKTKNSKTFWRLAIFCRCFKLVDR